MNPEVALVWLLQGGILRRGQPDPDPGLWGTRPGMSMLMCYPP